MKQTLAGLRVLYISGDLLHELLKGIRTTSAQTPSAVGVGIDVQHGLRAQLVAVLFHPFRGAHETELLGIPQGKHDGPFRFPSGFLQGAKYVSSFKNHRGSAYWIVRAVNPSIVVVTVDDPLIGRLPGDGGDYVMNRTDAVIELQAQMNLRRACADVISERQRAAPIIGGNGALQFFQDRLRVAVADRHHRNCHQRLGVFNSQLFATGFGSPAGRKWVANVKRHIHYTAALHALRRTEWTSGIDVAFPIAVVFRVRIDQTCHGSVFGSHFRFGSSPAFTVSSQHNLTADVNADLLQIFVILWNTVVYVNNRCCDFARSGVGIVAGKLMGVGGIRVFFEDRFGKTKLMPDGGNHFKDPFHRVGQQSLKGFDANVEARFTELFERVISHFLRCGGAGSVRLGGHGLDVLADARGVNGGDRF